MEKACTTILVGKKATIDGSTMIARNDDTFLPLTPQRFVMRPANDAQEGKLVSNQNGFTAELPVKAFRYTATPNADAEHLGVFDESSINEKNVALSATESVYGNERALAYDPWVTNGLAEDALQTMVAPYIESARGGVQYLGELIAKYGSPEGNGVLFSDKNEVWYMEIVTGHHWAATRIPDDAYAVAANQVAQQQIDFNDSTNYLWSEGIEEFVSEHHLNPDKEGWNFRHIFGTDTEKDRHYNTPRVWFGQRYLNPGIQQDPMSSELPFICHAERLITVTDLEYILSSHYNETQYDPLGHGSAVDKLKFRPIALNRTQNSHVLQIRNNVEPECAALMWVCFGIPSFTPYVPFYTNAHDTDPSWSETPLEYDIQSAYWMYRTLSMLVEAHHAEFIQEDLDYLKDCRELQLRLLAKGEKQLAGEKKVDATNFLTQQNYQISKAMQVKTMEMIGHFVTKGLTLSKLTFNMDKNL
ncbi:C69 family dipeptidase [Liquorilactobacillus capillatus]|uniref:Dipeptidase n=1 Tax=Liquorilactobacillus capillatus DSM 19910 TaxID=1423731 RepID=A0A0R1LYB3_9LACO|nr:C69 family dipeptidase [Liquorilactobacillus capillatus]KRL00607.1 dipeptidase A [Liquorilactobacillus capillatus DSM 19910]